MKFHQDSIPNWKEYLNISVWFYLAIFILHVFEGLAVATSSFSTPREGALYSMIGFLFDMGYTSRLLLILAIPFGIGYLISTKTGTVLRVLLTIILIIIAGLISFFVIAGFPLDKVVFIYSLNEIIDILRSSQKAPIWHYGFTLVLPVLFFIISKKNILRKQVLTIGTLIVFVLCACIPQPKEPLFNKIEKYNIVENKLAYMCKSFQKEDSFDFQTIDKKQIQNYTVFLQSKFPHLNFVNEEYPFLHKNNSPDVLSPFFKDQEELPNIVIIIAEGLGREFSGDNSLVASATPFLDSLSKGSLTWNNCLSTSQRTICVLPSVLGSLPMGKSGFMNYKESAPEFNSLYKTLKTNGYTTSFFYGGWLCFDDMCHFLKLNNVDTYLDVSLYDSVRQRNGWGLYDDFVFQKAIDTLTFDEQPRLDVFLTLTTHDPFEYPNEEKYCSLYRKILDKAGDSLESDKLLREYASYLYLDESIRNLIESYSSKPGFEKTIFIITGDHDFCTWREPMICHHVPLIIWSPLLSQSKQMDALVSHRDIYPSVISYLKNQYHINVPENESILNQGLDTARKFRSTTFSPLMDVSRHLYGLIYQDLFYFQNETYKITYTNKRLSTKKINNSPMMDSLSQIYKALDLYICENNLLVKNKISHGKTMKNLMRFSSNTTPKIFLSLYPTFEKTSFEGVKHAYATSDEFPLTIAKHTITKEEKGLEFAIHANIYIPLLNTEENSKEICIVTTISRNGKQIYWTSEGINNNWSNSYNTWLDFQTKKVMTKENYQFEEGDIIVFYIWNKAKRKFYMSNYGMNLSSFTYED